MENSELNNLDYHDLYNYAFQQAEKGENPFEILKLSNKKRLEEIMELYPLYRYVKIICTDINFCNYGKSINNKILHLKDAMKLEIIPNRECNRHTEFYKKGMEKYKSKYPFCTCLYMPMSDEDFELSKEILKKFNHKGDSK